MSSLGWSFKSALATPITIHAAIRHNAAKYWIRIEPHDGDPRLTTSFRRHPTGSGAAHDRANPLFRRWAAVPREQGGDRSGAAKCGGNSHLVPQPAGRRAHFGVLHQNNPLVRLQRLGRDFAARARGSAPSPRGSRLFQAPGSRCPSCQKQDLKGRGNTVVAEPKPFGVDGGGASQGGPTQWGAPP